MPDDPEPSDDETTEQRFRKLRAELEAMDLPDIPSDADADKLASRSLHVDLPEVPDVSAVTSKAWQAKERFEAGKKEAERRQRNDGDSARGLGFGLTVAYTIVGVPMLFILVGWFLDSRMHTDVYRGMGALVGSVLGIVAAIAQINCHSQPK